MRVAKRVAAQARYELSRDERETYFTAMWRIAETDASFFKRLKEIALMTGVKAAEPDVTAAADAVRRLHDCAANLYVEPDYGVYRESCKSC